MKRSEYITIAVNNFKAWKNRSDVYGRTKALTAFNFLEAEHGRMNEYEKEIALLIAESEG